MSVTQRKGQVAEDAALAYLLQQGLQLLDRNFRSRFGEIDLIMQEGETLVFIEVRQRQSARFGGAIASISNSKQQKILLTAEHFLASQPSVPACRFDVVGFEGHQAPLWIRHAFEAAG